MVALPADLKSYRLRLGLTQSEMAVPLGISKRALQSYEQGWRPIPIHVWERVALLLFLDWRAKNKGAAKACWQVRGCSAASRKVCAASRLGAAEVCWLVTGPEGGPTHKACAAGDGVACWENCPVTAAWIKA